MAIWRRPSVGLPMANIWPARSSAVTPSVVWMGRHSACMAARCEWFGQLRQPQLPGALQFLVGNSDPDGQVVKLGFAPLLDGLDLLALGVAKEKQRLIGRSEGSGRALLDLEPERPEPGFRFEADSDFLGQRRMLGHEAVMLVLHRIELRIEPSVEQGVVGAALLVKRSG